jgi:hypothetical protein
MAGERVEAAQVPPPGEAVHLPGPSYLPVATAAAIALTLLGLLLSWVIVAAGALITLVAIVRWVRSTREDLAELPLEH